MVILVVASVPVTILNLLNQFATLQLLSGAEYLKAFDPAQLQALAMVFLDMQKYGVYIAGIFWGLWLFPFGILVFKSGYFPRIMGVFLVIGCFGYLIDSLSVFLFPRYKEILSPITTTAQIIGEIPFLLWLLIRGAQVPGRNKEILDSA